MKYVFLFISLIAAGILFCGCSASQIASTKASGLLSPVLGLTGALAGAEFSKNESEGTRLAATGAAAAGAYLFGQFIENGFKDEKAKEYKAGYDLGRSNSVKELYWLYQKMHEAEEGEVQRSRIYELPVLYPSDGIKRVPDTVTLSVTE